MSVMTVVLPKRLPKITQLQAVVAVAKFGSINTAAKMLNLPQPTMSRSVRELEESLGVQLVIRGRLGISLTKAGESFVEHANSILAELDRSIEDARTISGKSNPKVSIGVSSITSNSILPKVMERMLSTYRPMIIDAFNNSVDENIPRLRSGKLDMVVGNYDALVSFSEFVVEPLFDCPFYIVCAKGHPLEKATSIEELQKAKWWLTNEFRICLRKHPDFMKLKIEQGVTTSSHVIAVPLVKEKGFLALLSTVQIKKYGPDLSIIPVPITPRVIGRYVLAYSKDHPLTSPMQRMIAILHQEADAYDWEILPPPLEQ